MAFKRAEWHSGLTYRQTCNQCRTVVEYMDDVLDFRPWYADGFVYCPRCKTPLRHDEKYARKVEVVRETSPTGSNEATSDAAFCTRCGNAFGFEDRFCAKCGNKR